eukprot:1767826-Rhodomonas_salina.3
MPCSDLAYAGPRTGYEDAPCAVLRSSCVLLCEHAYGDVVKETFTWDQKSPSSCAVSKRLGSTGTGLTMRTGVARRIFSRGFTGTGSSGAPGTGATLSARPPTPTTSSSATERAAEEGLSLIHI